MNGEQGSQSFHMPIKSATCRFIFSKNQERHWNYVKDANIAEESEEELLCNEESLAQKDKQTRLEKVLNIAVKTGQFSKDDEFKLPS